MSSSKRDWHLDRAGFDLLLQSLDPVRESAAKKYEELRHRLTFLFQCKGSTSPDTNADEVLDRVTRRLEEGEKIQNLYAYVAGVARLVLKEGFKQGVRASGALMAYVEVASADQTLSPELRTRCFEACLEKLPKASRDLIVEYCRGDWHTNLRRRAVIAKELGMSPTALRIRVHRIRMDLAKCFDRCIEELSKG